MGQFLCSASALCCSKCKPTLSLSIWAHIPQPICTCHTTGAKQQNFVGVNETPQLSNGCWFAQNCFQQTQFVALLIKTRWIQAVNFPLNILSGMGIGGNSSPTKPPLLPLKARQQSRNALHGMSSVIRVQPARKHQWINPLSEMFSFNCSYWHPSCVTAVPMSPVLLLGALTLSSSSASAERMIPKAPTALPPCAAACLSSAEGRHGFPGAGLLGSPGKGGQTHDMSQAQWHVAGTPVLVNFLSYSL